ncbi:hypothetical protein [Rivularia sp. UHCC 0363]|uniref:hypothetical protein n=1 Tax=Rivularia sp. UHCC 0363 TaxID=3110244 RepID=UPI002B1FE4EC|nr:hypothetical protein [Rivularia sp. UHCC 0363]MEA5598837.1 hypothetical protein [Rivularia sp. UHCC 0363]
MSQQFYKYCLKRLRGYFKSIRRLKPLLHKQNPPPWVKNVLVHKGGLSLCSRDLQSPGKVLNPTFKTSSKFRSEKPPEIHIGISRSEDQWLFSASDNGIEIEPQFSDRIKKA